MKMAVVLGAVLALALAGACKKKDGAAPANGSGSSSSAGSGSAVVAAAADAQGAPGPAPGAAVLEMKDIDEQDQHLAAAFGKQMPALPAMNADGTLLATLDNTGDGGMFPSPLQVTISQFPSGKNVESLDILTDEEAAHAENAGDKWVGPELAKQLATRGKAIMAKLQGFHSLKPVKLEAGEGFDKKPTKIGDLTLSADSTDDGLVLALTDGQGKAIHRERFAITRSTTFQNVPCSITPFLEAAYTDPPKPRALYVEVRYRYRDDCGTPDPDYLAWSTDPASTTPEEHIESLVEDQLDIVGLNNTESPFADDATIVSSGMTAKTDEVKLIGVAMKAMDYLDSKTSDVDIVQSRDGKTAWASATASVSLSEPNTVSEDTTWRLSDMLVQTAQGWRIAAAAWTEPMANAKANKDAKAGKVKAQTLEGDAGDASLNAAFAKLTAEGATNVAKDIVAIGSGPGERTVGAAAFAKPWNAAWKGKTTIVSSIARLAPSGTTGWVAATVELQKTGYKLPFTVFAVFDKDASGAWTLVHIHFAV